MSCASHDSSPVEDAGDRRHHRARRADIRRAPAPDRRNDQRAQHPDADERGHPAHARARGHASRAASTAATCPSSDHQRRGQRSARGRDGSSASRRLRAADARRGAPRRGDPQAIQAGAGDVPRLRRHQPRVGAARGRAARRGVPRLDDPPVVEHEDAVGADHARQPVREHQGRAARHEPVQRLLDRPPRSRRPPRTAPRRARGWARRGATRARSRCAGAGRPTAGRRARPRRVCVALRQRAR